MSKKILVFLAATMLMALMPLRASQAKTLTIAVIDTGIDKALPNLCKFGHKSFVNKPDLLIDEANPLTDNHGHGTHIAGLISKHAGEGSYCLVAIKYYSEANSGKQNLENMKQALRYAINIKVDFINISAGGPERDEDEYALIKEALDKGIKVDVAAGNEKSDLDKSCNYFPACYDKRLVVVGNLEITKDFRHLDPEMKLLGMLAGIGDKIGTYETQRSPTSNYGNYVNRWEIGTNVESTMPGGKTGYMSGTSQATAVATGEMVRVQLHK